MCPSPPFVIQLLKYLFETHFLQEYVIISPRSLRGRSWFLIGALVQHCIAIYSHLQPCSPMYSFVQPCTTLYSHVQYFTVMYSHDVQPCTALYSHLQPCTLYNTAMYSFVTAMYSCHVQLQPCTILYNHVRTASLFLLIELTNFAFYSINSTLPSGG